MSCTTNQHEQSNGEVPGPTSGQRQWQGFYVPKIEFKYTTLRGTVLNFGHVFAYKLDVARANSQQCVVMSTSDFKKKMALSSGVCTSHSLSMLMLS